MTWDEFYKKWIDSDHASEIIPHLPQLETMGSEEQVAEVIADLGDDDKTAGDHLLRQALDAGLTFTGENLAWIEGCCSEELWLQAVHTSAGHFTTADLDELQRTYDELTESYERYQERKNRR